MAHAVDQPMPLIDPAALLIGLREGLEAFLIIGILLGLLVQALFASFFENGPGAAWFEIIVALAAIAILTYMVLWMEKHTHTLTDTIKRKTERATIEGRWVILGSLAFFTVFREASRSSSLTGKTEFSAGS